jgi:hypothetical protein
VAGVFGAVSAGDASFVAARRDAAWPVSIGFERVGRSERSRHEKSLPLVIPYPDIVHDVARRTGKPVRRGVAAGVILSI